MLSLSSQEIKRYLKEDSEERVVAKLHVNLAKWKIVFQRAIRRLFFKEKVYKSYHEAAVKCPSELYQQESIIHLVTERAKQFRTKISVNGAICHMENVGALCLLDAINRLSLALKNQSIIVLDFGGGDGSYYWYVRKSLARHIHLQWYVIETPAMVIAMQEFSTNELHFVFSIQEALQKTENKADIVFASGSIQYTEKPWQTLNDLLSAEATYMIFNRQSLSLENFDIISIQSSLLSWHGAGSIPTGFSDRLIKYPHTSIRLCCFEETIKEKYNILYTYPEISGVKHTNKLKVIGLSYLCECKGL